MVVYPLMNTNEREELLNLFAAIKRTLTLEPTTCTAICMGAMGHLNSATVHFGSELVSA